MIAAFVVPEKKREYIEREAAYPLAKKICDAIDSEDFQRLNFGMRILDWIDDIPAADVRPVVRGKWIDHYEPYSTGEEWIEAQYGYECSICGRWEYEKEPFCNCGAKMEES